MRATPNRAARFMFRKKRTKLSDFLLEKADKSVCFYAGKVENSSAPLPEQCMLFCSSCVNEKSVWLFFIQEQVAKLIQLFLHTFLRNKDAFVFGYHCRAHASAHGVFYHNPVCFWAENNTDR